MSEPAPHTHAQSTIIIFKRRMRRAIGFLSWIFPIIIMGASYLMFPAMRAPATLPWNALPEVFMGLFFALLFVVIWFIVEMYYAANRETSVSQLQWDGIVSTIFGHVFTAFGAAMLMLQILPWWYLLPWVGVIMDSIFSSYFAVNNAAQKPLIQSEQR